MRKNISAILSFCLILSFSAQAQKKDRYYAADRASYPKKMELTDELFSYLAININKPIGDWKDTYAFGAEPEFGVRYHVSENWSITSRVALNYLFGKALEVYQPFIQKSRNEDGKQFTITGGARYNFNQSVWVNGELGYTNLSALTNTGGVTWGLSSGYDLFTRRNILGLGLGYQHFKLDNAKANAVSLKFRVYFSSREKIRN